MYHEFYSLVSISKPLTGTVKSEENYFYPPETMFEPPNFSLYISPRLAPTPRGRNATSVPATKRGGMSKDTMYNERAKQGFKYWPHEQKPIDCKLRYDSKFSAIGVI